MAESLMRYNILFTYITPFHPERGGIGRVTDVLTREFQRRGHRVYYLIYESGITIKHEFDYPASLDYFPSRELLSADNINFYQKFLIKNKIDFVINQSGNFSDTELYLQKGDSHAKVINVLHTEPLCAYRHLWDDIIPLRNSSFRERLKQIARVIIYPKIKRAYYESRKAWFNRLLPVAETLCTLTPRHFADINQLCPGHDAKLTSIPNPNTYSDSDLVTLSHTKKEKIILCCSLLVGNKRVDRVLLAWKKIYRRFPEWQLIILGGGKDTYVEKLKKLASGCDRVRFEGFQPPLPYYAKASILAFPSNYEGWGMSVTEAMQCGVVPLLFDSYAAAREIVEHEVSGIICPPFDMTFFTASLCRLMEDSELLSRMSANAKRKVMEYNVGNVVDKWEELFSKMKRNEAKSN